MITHHYDHSSSQNLLGTKWSNILLFRSDVHNNWSEKIENSRTQNRCTLLHRPLLSKHCHNSNTNTFGLHEYRIICNVQVATCNVQVASRHFGFFDHFSINFNFCLKKSVVSPKWSNYDRSQTFEKLCPPLWSNYDHPPLWSFGLASV